MDYPKPPDFDAEITIFPLGPTTRSSPARNGIRWAFAFAEDHYAGRRDQSDIWPEFLDDDGEQLPANVPLEGVLKAHMRMLIIDWSHPYAQRIRIGTAFFMMEGSHRVASGVVTTLFRPE